MRLITSNYSTYNDKGVGRDSFPSSHLYPARSGSLRNSLSSIPSVMYPGGKHGCYSAPWSCSTFYHTGSTLYVTLVHYLSLISRISPHSHET